MNRISAVASQVGTLARELAASTAEAGPWRRPRGVDAAEASFLLEATRILASSLDLETTLASVARLSLPHMGSWCIVDLCDGGQLRRVAIVHSDPGQQRLADALRSGWPPQRDAPLGVPLAVRTRRCEVVFPVTDEMLIAAAQSPENLEMLRALQIGSFMTVPLLARGAVLGAITYLAPNHGDSFCVRERLLAEDLAARCAIAIDNSRLFQQARKAQAQAEAANLVKMRFLSTMSHELRTPLNAIAGYVELLEAGVRGPLTERQLADLRRIRVNESHLLALVEAVLSYARLDAGRIEFHCADVLLASVLADTAALITPLANKKGIAVNGFSQPGEMSDLAVYADPEKLQQILVNLLTNAIKFSPGGGAVAIACEPLGERVEIRVTDHGTGIAAEHLGAIFEPFVQVGEGLKKKHGGIGLGLAISREAAVGMGGGLSVESARGQGSTFTLALSRGRG